MDADHNFSSKALGNKIHTIEEREGSVDQIYAIVCHLNYKITIGEKGIWPFLGLITISVQF